jgi:hypothetical protein
MLKRARYVHTCTLDKYVDVESFEVVPPLSRVSRELTEFTSKSTPLRAFGPGAGMKSFVASPVQPKYQV